MVSTPARIAAPQERTRVALSDASYRLARIARMLSTSEEGGRSTGKTARTSQGVGM